MYVTADRARTYTIRFRLYGFDSAIVARFKAFHCERIVVRRNGRRLISVTSSSIFRKPSEMLGKSARKTMATNGTVLNVYRRIFHIYTRSYWYAVYSNE